MSDGKHFEVGDVNQFVAGGTINEGGHSNAMSNVFHIGGRPDVAQQLVVINESQRQILAKRVSATVTATGKTYDDITIELHAKFNIERLADLPHQHFPEAIVMLEAWQTNPPEPFGGAEVIPSFRKRNSVSSHRFFSRVVFGSACTVLLVSIVGGTVLSSRLFVVQQCLYDGKSFSPGSVITMRESKVACTVEDGLAVWRDK